VHVDVNAAVLVEGVRHFLYCGHKIEGLATLDRGSKQDQLTFGEGLLKGL
jgi:hypothetical protein